MLSRASPQSTAAFHAFLREGGALNSPLKPDEDDKLAGGEGESDGGAGIDFIQALSDRGDHENLASARDFLTTKARLFGDQLSERTDEDDEDDDRGEDGNEENPEDAAGSEEDDDEEFEQGEAKEMIRALRQRLKLFKRAYQS